MTLHQFLQVQMRRLTFNGWLVLVDFLPSSCWPLRFCVPLIGFLDTSFLFSQLSVAKVGFFFYCWFSALHHSKQIKIKIKTVQQIKSRIWKKQKVNMQRLSPKFRLRQFFVCKIYGKNCLPKFIEICMETACCQMGTNMAAGNQQRHLSLGWLQKRKLISQGRQKPRACLLICTICSRVVFNTACD